MTRAPGSMFTVFAALAGALPLLTLLAWYRLGLVAWAEIGPYRTLALFGVAAMGLALLALALTGPVWALGGCRAPGWVRVGFFVGVVANLAGLGLLVFYQSLRWAPVSAKAAAAAFVLVLAAAFWRYTPETQTFVSRLLTRAGLALLLVPVGAGPWIALDAARFGHPMPGAVAPLPGARALPGAPRRILLVTFDALYAGRTSLIDPGLGTTPSLSAIAEEATHFANCRSAGDMTLVSLGTLLTGLSPSTIQPRLDNKLGFIPAGAVTGLGGHLAPAGYRASYANMIAHPNHFGLIGEFAAGTLNTRAFFTESFYSPHYLPLGEAADYFRYGVLKQRRPPSAPGYVQHPLPAIPKTLDQARALLQRGEGPAFLWVHIGAPHLPYAGVKYRPDGTIDQAATRHVPEHEAYAANAQADPARALEIRGIYDDYVRHTDRQFGRFIDGLREDGLWDDTLLVVTADHGESHRPGHIGHSGTTLHKDQTHVPLLIRRPHQRAAARVDQVVGHLDLVPTILAEVYGRIPPGLPGHPLLQSLPDAERTLFTYGWLDRAKQVPPVPQSIAAYQGRYVYVDDRVAGQEWLYDTQADPEEQHDVSAAHPAVTARLRRAVAEEREKF